jgi:hypothetical protein
MTVFATLVFICIMFWCGIGPVLLMRGQRPAGRRVLLLPFVGISTHILFCLALARFDLTGRTISIASLVFFSALACWGLYRAPLSREEVRQSAAPILFGLASMIFIGWPLFRVGMDSYWGYANPDQVFLTGALEWMYKHPFGVPPGYPVNEFSFRGIAQNTLLGVFYLITTTATVLRISPEFLFNVAEAAMVFLTPLGIILFSESVGLSRRRSLLLAGCIGCSSLVGYTFYLNSLAATTVIAIVPVAIALLLEFGEDRGTRTAVLFAIVAAAMFYNYLGAIGVLGSLSAASVAYLVVNRKMIGRILLPAGITVGVIAVTYTPFAYSIWQYFLAEAISSRLSSFQKSAPEIAELLTSFSMSYTEVGVPFFWGFQIPHLPPLAGGASAAMIWFAAGCACFAILALSLSTRLTGLSSSYRYLLAAAVLPIFAYAFREMGYGVFKLVAWIHPIVLTGFVAAACGIAGVLRRRSRALSMIPYAFVAMYLIINIGMVRRLGSYTTSDSRSGSPQSAVNGTYSDVREVRTLATPSNAGRILIVVPDVVMQSWLVDALRPVSAKAFPPLVLVAEDSSPRADPEERPEAAVLHWVNAKRDITPSFKSAPAWSNAAFGLTPIDRLHDAMIVGYGWYRLEGTAEADVGWQKRYRWLRKRGEILLWNPDHRPHRLMLTMTSGYGNSSPERHVSVFLNGQKFDELQFSASARLITKPFVATSQLTQLELEIREDAEPLPRQRPLWAAKIPREPRRLNVAVSEIALIEGDGFGRVAPSSIDLRTEFQTPRALMEGVFSDGWVGRSASFFLRNGEARQVELSGMLPQAPGLAVPFPIVVTIDGQPIGQAVLTTFGHFRTSVPLPREVNGTNPAPTYRVGIKPGGTFSGHNGDSRTLSVQLEYVALSK